MPSPGDPPRQVAAGASAPGAAVLPAAVLLVAVLLAYLPALRGGFIWDDHDWIVDNTLLRDAEGLRRIWLEPRAFHQYYPLTHSSFWLEYQLWGLDTTGYHLVNVALHALSALLLWRVLRGLSLRGAFAAALLFALHPVAVESVAWITERKNVLSAALALGSLSCWLPFLVEPDPRPLSRGRGRYAAASVLYGLALLAKTAVCTLPGLLLLLRWWRQGRLRPADFAALAPWLAPTLALGATTAWLERHEVGAQGVQWALQPAERILVAGRALWFYAGKLLLPVELSFIYPRFEVSTADLLQSLWPLAALALFGLLFAWRGRIGRGPFVAAAAYAGLLSPTLGFFDVYAMRFSYVADHWGYHAAPALLAALAHGGSRLLDRAPTALRWGPPTLVAAVFFALTRAQAGHYVDQETLYRDTLRHNPACAMAHANLGVVLLSEGRRAEGLSHLAEAHRLDPDDMVAAMNLGIALDLSGRDAEAAALYEQLLERQPSQGEVQNALADLLGRSRDPAVRDPARAVVLAERALQAATPAPAEVWATLSQAYAAAGRGEDARRAAAQGLEVARAAGDARLVALFERRLAR